MINLPFGHHIITETGRADFIFHYRCPFVGGLSRKYGWHGRNSSWSIPGNQQSIRKIIYVCPILTFSYSQTRTFFAPPLLQVCFYHRQVYRRESIGESVEWKLF
ncbi:hypothetical protein EL84_15070 [Paenibacillus sp. VT-400]|nr:hypothetical protein EL84_15070 [Paenibacillus sp. VT-400]